MKRRVLGWDISSSTIGFCVLDFDTETKEIKYTKYGYHNPIKEGSILDRLMDTKKAVAKIIKDFSDLSDEVEQCDIAIEDIIQHIQGKSSAATIITLAVFNRMVGIAAYEALGKSPELFNVMTIRHGLKFTKELPAKEQMPEIVAQHLGIEFPYQYKINRRTKLQEIKTESFDTADAFSVALYYARRECGFIAVKKPKAVKSKSKEKVVKVKKTKVKE